MIPVSTEPRPLGWLLAAALLGCSPERWPVCGNEEELTAEDYEGGASGDFLVCTALPEDGSACPDHEDVDPYALFEAEVGPASADGQGVLLRTDCGPETTREDACCYVLEVEGSWVAGRPYTVDGQPRVATLTVGGPLPADGLRARLAREWAGVARAEHASVASFARFSMELRALGAPAALLAEAARAQADEVRHARLAFGLASTYAGSPVAAGRLAVAGLSGEPDAASIAAALAREGCVGETIAAALATVALDGARVPEARRALRLIAADEARHAALAWRAARWLLGAFPAAHAAFEDAFWDEAGRALAPVDAPAEPLAAELRAHGVLPEADARREAARAARDVVVPLWGILAASGRG